MRTCGMPRGTTNGLLVFQYGYSSGLVMSGTACTRVRSIG